MGIECTHGAWLAPAAVPIERNGVWELKVVPLKRLLDRRQVGELLQSCANLSAQAIALAIADATGAWFSACPTEPRADALVQRVRSTGLAASSEGALAMPLIVEETLYGVLYSYPAAEALSNALSQAVSMLIQGALSQKALAKETLDRYREINLLYHIHETIGSSVELDEVISRVLEESIRTIKAEGGSVLLADDLTGRLIKQDSVGLDVASTEDALISMALSEKVFRTGKPGILNSLEDFVRPEDPYDVQLVSLLCAPFKLTDRTLGVIALGRTRAGSMFTAADLKLLTALASQAGIAIANARQVEVREHRLKQQIKDLRIKVDEAKKQRQVSEITESEFFSHLQETARIMRAEFDV
jgi:GAF domain-containing protein